jgi:hypothetical protein
MMDGTQAATPHFAVTLRARRKGDGTLKLPRKPGGITWLSGIVVRDGDTHLPVGSLVDIHLDEFTLQTIDGRISALAAAQKIATKVWHDVLSLIEWFPFLCSMGFLVFFLSSPFNSLTPILP